VNNSTEAVTGSITLPGPGSTESVVISVDGTIGYAAVPASPVPLGAPGGVVVMNLTGAAVTGTVPVPSARYVVQNGDGANSWSSATIRIL